MTDAEGFRTFPIAALKYIPNERERESWIALARTGPVERDPKGLPIPPDALLAGYADNAANYLEGGALHMRSIDEKLRASGFELSSARRILDLGSGIGRMIRHVADYNPSAETWGVDVSAKHIQWCKQHLSPPYYFATTTILPHLPFPDGHFDVIYAGSVFTHIEDLADAWILEVRRVLSDRGRAYITIHDEETIRLLETIYTTHWLGDQLRSDPGYQAHKNDFGMIVIGRGIDCQVFFTHEYFTRMLMPSFRVEAVYPAAHGYQAVYVLSPL